MQQHAAPGGNELLLIDLATRGDQEAFRQIVLLYETKIFAYLLQMLGNRENAYDVAQETFILLYHSLPQWQPPIHAHTSPHVSYDNLLSPWLYRIATNQAISLLRKQKVRQRVLVADIPATENETEEWIRPIPTEDSFEDRYLARSFLREALAQLSEEDASCLVLHFVCAERYAEIAQRLGFTSEAVRKRVARGLIVLRKIYAQQDQEECS